MVLNVHKLSISVHPLESVAAVAVVEAPSTGSAVIAKEHETSMVAFGCAGEEIENAIIVKKEILRISQLRTDGIRALNGIATEENGLGESVQVHTLGDRWLTKFSPTMS